MKKKGTLCISLDFEKFWGFHDIQNIKSNEQNLLKVTDIVNRTLELFKQYDIHCTWAIVGMLNFDSLEQLENYCEHVQINYNQNNYSPLPLIKHNLQSINSNSYLAKIEIEKIKKSKNQEVASHTFSHLYCLEGGLTTKDFQNDINMFTTLIGEVNSIVFPRNQINQTYISLFSKNKTITYRGNQENKFWKNSDYKTESLFKKMGRTLDAYIKFSKDNLIEWHSIKKGNTFNIPASRFLKPYHLPKLIENLKLKRIKKQMQSAAIQNKIYHLWWHPHNFGNNTEENFSQLENILQYYTALNNKHGFQSLNMNEISKSID